MTATREECLAAFDRAVEASLARQAARPPREAARAALGLRASEAQVAAWLRAHRPDAVSAS